MTWDLADRFFFFYFEGFNWALVNSKQVGTWLVMLLVPIFLLDK